jgi:hypothetical protein
MAKKVIYFVLDDISKEFVPISKWSCDGSTGQSELMQRSLDGADVSDIFITPVVSLQFIKKNMEINLFFGIILGLW